MNNNNLFLTIFTLFTTINLQAQTGLQITSSCQNSSICLPLGECGSVNFISTFSATSDCSDPSLNYNFEIDFNDDGVIDSVGTATTLNADFPLGNHRIIFTAFDFCNQTASCEIEVEMKDCEAPDLSNVPFLTQAYLEYGCVLPLNARELFSSYVTDNCTNVNDLIFTFSTNLADSIQIFECDQSDYPDHLYVTDQSGNQDSTEIYILPYAPTGFECGDAVPWSWAQSSFWQGDNMNDDMDFFADGVQYFGNIQHTLCWGSNYPLGDTLTYLYTGDTTVLNGVSTYDIILIKKHILGINPFYSPYQHIAADVDESNSVTALDVVKIQNLLLHNTDHFSSGKSWVFDPEYYLIDSVQYNYYMGELLFTGVKLGDVSGNADPNLFQDSQTETRSNSFLLLSTKDHTFNSLETLAIPIFSTNFQNIIGAQFTIKFDPKILDFKNVGGNDNLDLGNDNFGFSLIDDGLILCSWNNEEGENLAVDQAFFTLNFLAKKEGKLSNHLTINSEKIKAEVYVEKNGDFDFWEINLGFENEVESTDFSISPNPFFEKTIVSFSTEKESEASLSIFDMTGKVIFSQIKNTIVGENQWNISRSELPTNGIYLIKIKTDTQIFSSKMVRN